MPPYDAQAATPIAGRLRNRFADARAGPAELERIGSGALQSVAPQKSAPEARILVELGPSVQAGGIEPRHEPRHDRDAQTWSRRRGSPRPADVEGDPWKSERDGCLAELRSAGAPMAASDPASPRPVAPWHLESSTPARAETNPGASTPQRVGRSGGRPSMARQGGSPCGLNVSWVSAQNCGIHAPTQGLSTSRPTSAAAGLRRPIGANTTRIVAAAARSWAPAIP